MRSGARTTRARRSPRSPTRHFAHLDGGSTDRVIDELIVALVNGLVLTIRIVLVRVAFAVARHLRLRRRVVLATAHSPRLGGNLAAIADDLGDAPPRDPGRHHRPSPGIGRTWPGRRGVAGGRGRLPPGDRPGVHRRRLLLPDLRRPAASRDHDHPDVARLRGVQEGRLQRARQVVRGRRGARRAACAIHSNYDVCLVASQSAAPHYAEAFRQPLDRFVSRLGIPRTDVLFGEERLARTREAVRRPLRPDRRSAGHPLRPDVPRRQRHRRPRHRRPRPRASCARRSARTTSCSSGSTRSSASRTRDRPGARGLRDRRLRPSRHQRADAGQRRPRHRLLERDLRVRAARPADGLLRPRLRGLRSASAASTSTTGPGSRARSSRPPRHSRGTFEPGISTSSGWSVSARRRSTSPMDVPRRASRTS